MSVESVQSFFALAIGFALAGLLASGYQAATSRPASFRLLHRGPHPAAFAAVPFLVFAAPFIIMRNILRRRQIEGWRFWVVMSATMVAGFWSLMSGTVAISLLMALGLFGM
jgi:Sugar efflux transporter for intercellular exchange